MHPFAALWHLLAMSLFTRIAVAVLTVVLGITSAHAQSREPRAIIADLRSHSAPGSIEERIAIPLGGVEQWVSIRGADQRNPILIYVHGGPGRPNMPAAWPYQRAWEDYFTVVEWDQRGAGLTYARAREEGRAAMIETLSFDRVTEDAVELMAYLRERFGQERVFILGHSWGGAVAFNAAMRRADWVHACVGLSPLLNMQENERVSYEMVLAEARRRNDAAAIAELEALGPYPGDLTMERLGVERGYVMRYGGLAAYRDNASHFFNATFLSPDYEPEERNRINDASLATVEHLLPELAQIDVTTVRRVAFPVVMLLGRHDLSTPSQVAVDWLARLDAPVERIVWFEHSAHLAPIEEPGRVLTALVEEVRPLAERRRRR